MLLWSKPRERVNHSGVAARVPGQIPMESCTGFRPSFFLGAKGSQRCNHRGPTHPRSQPHDAIAVSKSRRRKGATVPCPSPFARLRRGVGAQNVKGGRLTAPQLFLDATLRHLSFACFHGCPVIGYPKQAASTFPHCVSPAPRKKSKNASSQDAYMGHAAKVSAMIVRGIPVRRRRSFLGRWRLGTGKPGSSVESSLPRREGMQGVCPSARATQTGSGSRRGICFLAGTLTAARRAAAALSHLRRPSHRLPAGPVLSYDAPSQKFIYSWECVLTVLLHVHILLFGMEIHGMFHN